MYKMQRLEVSGAVRLIYRSLGVKGLRKLLQRPQWQYDFGRWGVRCVFFNGAIELCIAII